MALDLTKDIIEEIRSRCDIAELISSCGVVLKRSGSSNFKGLCPFHQEKTPSFHVDTARQAFHCFGCGKGGDVFRFFMDKENVDFLNAAQILAARCGVIIPEKSFNQRERSENNERDRLFAINEEFSDFFCRNLQNNPDSPAARYLSDRGIPQDIIKKFRIGFAPDSWTACLEYGRKLGFSEAEMVASGIARRKEDTGRVYDQFKGRITFTIENEQGRAVGFSARTLEAKPADGRKYVNTPDTPVFHKGRLLYALPQARQGIGKAKMAVLCEGQLDAIAFHRAGFDCAVAPLGTAFTPEQAKIIRRYSQNLILAFDADGAGRKAVLRAAEILLPLSVDLKVLKIPGGKDPDELYAQGGSSAVADALNNAVNWMEILQEAIAEKFDTSTPVGRSQAASFVADYLKLITNQVELEVYLQDAASMLNVSMEAMRSILLERQAAAVQFPKQQTEKIAEKSPAAEKDPAHTALLTLFELALLSVNNGRMIAELLPPETISASNDPVARALELAINSALNDEFDSLASDLENFLLETPCSEISKALVKTTAFANPAKAVQEAVSDVNRIRQMTERENLLAELRGELDDTRKLEILMQIQKLNSATQF